MGNVSTIGRIFYGIAITGMGVLTISYKDFPYMLIPPEHSWTPGLALMAYISGAALILGGGCLAFKKNTRLPNFIEG